jgi:S-formylglutathione hydrolase FrmB
MDRDIYNVIVTPAQYSDAYAMPVVYLLHGHGDDHTKWVNQTQPKLPQLANQYGIILVCPNGEQSWYFDSYNNPKNQFETYVSKELIEYVDKNYKTIRSPHARAITGFSMGGHGALWNAFRHPDVFGACGSLSGGVDFRAFPNNWHIKDHLGEQKDNVERWDQSTALSQIDKIKPGQSIAIDCGVDDFFYPCNVALHEALLKKKIPHDYTIRPGGHSHAYWGNAILYQLVFFTEHFKRNASGK